MLQSPISYFPNINSSIHLMLNLCWKAWNWWLLHETQRFLDCTYVDCMMISCCKSMNCVHKIVVFHATVNKSIVWASESHATVNQITVLFFLFWFCVTFSWRLLGACVLSCLRPWWAFFVIRVLCNFLLLSPRRGPPSCWWPWLDSLFHRGLRLPVFVALFKP